MSGDVQPRKRKDKRRKKDVPVVGLQPEYMAQKVKTPNIEDSPEDVPLSKFSPEETIHVHNDHGTGGNICAKIVFFCLFGVLTVMVGLIVIQYRGSSEVDIPAAESKWASILDGWIDDSPAHHDEPDQHAASEEDHNASEEDHCASEEDHGASEEDHDASEEDQDSSKQVEDSEEQVSKEDQEVSEEDQVGSEEDQVSKEDREVSEEDQEVSDEDQEVSEEDQEVSEEDQEVSEEDQEVSEEDQEVSKEDEEVSKEQDEEESDEDQLDIPGVTESVESQEEDEEDAARSGEDNEDEVDDSLEQGDGDQDKEEVEGEGDVEEEETEASGAPAAAELTPEESEEEESDDTPAAPTPVVPPRQRGGPREQEEVLGSSAQVAEEFPQDTIEVETTVEFSEELDLAEARLNEDPSSALQLFSTVLAAEPNNVRALHGKAVTLDKMADLSRSNARLEEAIQTYKRLLLLGPLLEDNLFLVTAKRCINRMRFKGDQLKAVEIHTMLIERYPADPKYRNELAVTYLMINRVPEARHHLEATLKKWPNDGFALAHLGFILKTTDNNLSLAVDYLTRGIASRAKGTIDGRFFFQLGDALSRLGRSEEATTINQLGVREGVFLSEYQRSLYNVNRLKANPWWTPQESTYKSYFDKLEANWEAIRKEGVAALLDKKNNHFRDESESLRDVGDWKQLELFARGRKLAKNCVQTPHTCQLIEDFPAARDCRRGQVKFSVMEPGTHVFPHCGPTNCRLRAHLGLTVPPGTAIRVATETRSWQEGKVLIFDDSFEHEVWHNGTTTRLVLIVDVWHPQLTDQERKTLPAI